jgi:hypothetical protein
VLDRFATIWYKIAHLIANILRSFAVNSVNLSFARRRLAFLVALMSLSLMPVLADDKPARDDTPKIKPAAGVGDSAVPLNKNGTVLLDKKGKRVLLKAKVALRQGALEMLCCLKQTKEHESILSLDARAQEVHAALLAIDARPGMPVQYNPEYQAPTGQKIEIFVNWTDETGTAHRAAAQSWVRQAVNRFYVAKMDALPKGLELPGNTELRFDRKLKELSWYGPMSAAQKKEFMALSNDKEYRAAIESFFEQSQAKEMKADWVFAGSGFYTDEETGKKSYLAEGGDLICVANFADATIDVAIPSSADDSNRNFEAYTERIPPKDTPVTIELIPITAEKKDGPKQK